MASNPSAVAPVFVPPHTISRRDYLRQDSDAFFRETIYALVEGADRLLVCREVFGRAISLTPNQFVVLMGVAHLQGASGVTIRDLAQHASLAATHTTTEVGRLVRRRLLVKRKSPHDGRSVLVTLSPTGEAAVEEVAPLLRRVNDLLFANISAKELEIVRTMFTKLVLNAEYAIADLRQGGNGRPETS
jgi:DNA-binding MarR family transcriptional regulator